MAASFVSSEVATNGSTPQTLVAAPGTGEQIEIHSMPCHNRDTASHTIITKKVGGLVTPFEISKVVLAAGEHGDLMGAAKAVVLDGTGETITIESNAPASTTEPLAHYAGLKVP